MQNVNVTQNQIMQVKMMLDIRWLEYTRENAYHLLVV